MNFGDRNLRSLYDEAYYRDQLHAEHWFHSNRAKQELRWQEILRMVRPDSTDTVLDLGCAIGEYTFRIAPLVGLTIGVDFSEAAIALACRAATLREQHVRFVAASVDLLPFRPEMIDKAIAVDLVEHIDDATLSRMLVEVWRVLRRGGTLSIYTPCRTHYVERLKAHNLLLKQVPGHIAVRTPDEYERIFSAMPWRIDLRYFSPSTYPVFHWLDRWLARRPIIGSPFRFRYCLVLKKPA